MLKALDRRREVRVLAVRVSAVLHEAVGGSDVHTTQQARILEAVARI